MRRQSKKASVVLVALSCVTVLGIAMASFLAVTNQAMRLSNRDYAKVVSKQLAEMGLGRALRALSYNTFTGWNPDADAPSSTPPTVATTTRRTTTIASSNYGTSGITTAINVRVDNYIASVWSAGATYTTNSTVWYRGNWFRCKLAHANRIPPDTTYWTSAPAVWSADTTYSSGDIALVADTAAATTKRYVCAVANSNRTPANPLNASYWSAGANVVAWSSASTYAIDEVALVGSIPYRCILGHTNQTPPNATYWVSAPVIYSEGVVTLPDSAATTITTQLRATIALAPLFPNAIAANTTVRLTSGTVDSYNSALGAAPSYNVTGSPFSVANPNIGSSAVVAGRNTAGTAVALGTVRLNGYVAAPPATTTPYAPQYTFTAGSTIVTSTPASTVPPTKMDLSRVSRSPYIPDFDFDTTVGSFTALPAPSSGTTLVSGETVLGAVGTPGTANPTLYYRISSSPSGTGLNLTNATDILRIIGPVVLYVSGRFLTMADGKVVIEPTGSLEVFASLSRNVGIGQLGTGGFENQTSDPTKLFISVISSNASNNTLNYHFLKVPAAMPFYGAIFMPESWITVSSDNYPIFGALCAKNIEFLTGTAVNFHYDTALRTAGPAGTAGPFTTAKSAGMGFDAIPFKIAELRELTDPSEKIVLP